MVLRYCAICVIPTLVYTLYCMCWLRSQKCQIVCLTHCSDLFIQWLEWIRKRNQSIHAWVVYKTFAFSLYYPQTGFLCVILCFHHHILNGTEGIFFFFCIWPINSQIFWCQHVGGDQIHNRFNQRISYRWEQKQKMKEYFNILSYFITKGKSATSV